jgi:translation elongation factor EF-1alpha
MSQDHNPSEALGSVTHYFSHLSVAAVQLNAPLRVGDRIHIKGHTSDVIQTVESLEVNRQKIDQARPGDDVALKVDDHVREHDLIFMED